jgi:hypothetical protein
MKKIIVLFIISLGMMSFKYNKEKNSNGKLTEIQLNFVKENYNWNTEDIIIVNFRQPRTNCSYDNYINLNNSVSWWNSFYSKINLKNTLNIFVYSNKKAALNVIDSKTHFEDKNNFFLNIFFSDVRECYGLLVINKLGYYKKINGEYSENEVTNFIESLVLK